MQVSLLTGVLAADGLLVADGSHVGAAVAGAIRHVEVDVEPVHPGADTVVVVELGGEAMTERRYAGRKKSKLDFG